MNRSKRQDDRMRGRRLLRAGVALRRSVAGRLAQATFPDPNANCPPSECGQVSPLIPMQSVEAVHMGLVWKTGSQNPKILYHSRFPQYMVNDMADPELVDLAIERGALTTAGNQFNASLRDVLHGFDSPATPFLGLRPTDCTAGTPAPIARRTTRSRGSPTAAT